jgi:hypothetical protein
MNNVEGLGYAIDPFIKNMQSYFVLSKLYELQLGQFRA